MERGASNLEYRISKVIDYILLAGKSLDEILQAEIVDFSSKNIEELFDLLLNGKGYIRYHEIIFHVDKYSGTNIVSIYFGSDIENHIGNYNFSIQNEKNEICFMNHHRWVNGDRRKGIGTKHLKRLEKFFSDLGKSLSKKVFFEFVFVEKQEDTKFWLKKNGYNQEGDGYFVKALI